MDINYVCNRKRREFGKPCAFMDVGPNLILEIDSNPERQKDYHRIPKIDREVDNSVRTCVHEVNTVTYPTEIRGMCHTEGGWPASVDISDEESMVRFRKKFDKDKSFVNCVKSLADFIEYFVMENKSIDIYEEYFKGERIDSSENVCSTKNTFYDFGRDYRSVVDISWTMDSSKFAAAYSLKQSNEYSLDMCLDSYVWDAEKGDSPVCTLKPEVYLTCIECSPIDVNLVLGGYVSGQVAVFDIRESGHPQQLSSALTSHSKKVTGLKWLAGKQDMIFYSASNDGKLNAWDPRNLSTPIESLQLDSNSNIPNVDKNYSISCVEYDATTPYKFIVGTEQGDVLSFNRKYKDIEHILDSVYECSSGPLLAIERNSYFPQLFASCDSWSVKLWSEEMNNAPVLNIATHDGYFTDIAWSSSRVSTIFASKTTGNLEIWDVPGKNRSPLLEVHLSDVGLFSVAVSENGKNVACGTSSGRVQLVSIPKYLQDCSDLETEVVKNCIKGHDNVIGGQPRRKRMLERETEVISPAIVTVDEWWDPPEKADEMREEYEKLSKEMVNQEHGHHEEDDTLVSDANIEDKVNVREDDHKEEETLVSDAKIEDKVNVHVDNHEQDDTLVSDAETKNKVNVHQDDHKEDNTSASDAKTEDKVNVHKEDHEEEDTLVSDAKTEDKVNVHEEDDTLVSDAETEDKINVHEDGHAADTDTTNENKSDSEDGEK